MPQLTGQGRPAPVPQPARPSWRPPLASLGPIIRLTRRLRGDPPGPEASGLRAPLPKRCILRCCWRCLCDRAGTVCLQERGFSLSSTGAGIGPAALRNGLQPTGGSTRWIRQAFICLPRQRTTPLHTCSPMLQSAVRYPAGTSESLQPAKKQSGMRLITTATENGRAG